MKHPDFFPFDEQMKTVKEACKLSTATKEVKKLQGWVEDQFCSGYKTGTIVAELMDMGMPQAVATKFVSNCWKAMIAGVHAVQDDAVNIAMRRLHYIYREAMEANDRQNALKATELFCKLSGLFKEKLEITTDTYRMDFGNGDETEKDKD